MNDRFEFYDTLYLDLNDGPQYLNNELKSGAVQVNDRYEFYDELDLDHEDGRYLSPKADRSVRQLYKLHSVLVHSGGSHGGHYYAYIRPDGEKWFKFDDEAVTPADSKDAIEGQFGGEPEGVVGGGAIRSSAHPPFFQVYG